MLREWRSMANIVLRKYQEDAVKFALKVKKALFCMRVGSGKTICAMFSLRSLFKAKQIDKAIIACTKSSVSVFKKDFKDKGNVDVRLIEDENELINFLKSSDEKVCLVKHSMFEKAGSDINILNQLERIAKVRRVCLIVDEAHKIQNPDGIAQEAYHRMDFLFDRVLLYTATPYSSCLSQFWGLICVIHPEIWPTKRSFYSRHIDEVAIKDPRTHRVVRKEKVRYRNLAEFRKKIEPFTYFYYPIIPLVHMEHHTQLSLEHMAEYNELCKGTLTDEDLLKIKESE